MYTQLTEKGINFIQTICKGTGNSLLQGKSKFHTDDNPNGVLPYCSPATLPTKIWVSSAKYNGNYITNNQQLGEALVGWYNKYGKQYQMDANIMAAQAYQESGYNVWNYALTSTASGISQFVVEAVFDIIVTNKGSAAPFTTSEIALITNGLQGNILDKNSYKVATELGKSNRPLLHQNIIDNPEIMVKAQFRFMKNIATQYGGLASSVLFGYNRGPAFIKSNYTDTIRSAASHADGYEDEGIDYVFKIFGILGDRDNRIAAGYKPRGIYFGYDNLQMTLPPAQQAQKFDDFKADVAGSTKV
jgi:hypothetical protein